MPPISHLIGNSLRQQPPFIVERSDFVVEEQQQRDGRKKGAGWQSAPPRSCCQSVPKTILRRHRQAADSRSTLKENPAFRNQMLAELTMAPPVVMKKCYKSTMPDSQSGIG
jgi:hypothetical protein